ALSVAMVILLTATACTLDDPTPSTDNKAAQQAEATAPEPAASEPAPDAGTATQPAEATPTVPASTVAKRVDDGTDGGAGGDGSGSEDGRPLPDGTLTAGGHYADPRGETYEQFQASFDRTHPFQGLESFCLPTPAPESDPVATEPGITADSLNVVHLHTRLDELERIGFSVPVGDIDDMVRSFVGIVNGCGGIHGRRLDLRTVEVSALGGGGHDIDTRREAACLEAREVHEAVAVLAVEAVPGTAANCLTRSGRTSFLSVRGTSDRDESRAGGLLLAQEPGARTAVEAMVRMADERDLLMGGTIGLVVPDAPQRSDDVVHVLVDALGALGHEPTIHLVGCEGTTTCRVGLDTAVAAMVERGVDVVFPLLNRTSLPWLVLEMLDQAMPRPTFIQSGLDAQGLDSVSSEVAEFGGSPAGAYYSGAWILDASATGSHRLDGFETRPFDEMCNRSYAEAAQRRTATVDDPTTDVYRTVTEACSLVRAVARAVHDAGPDPTRLGIQVALAALGSMDVSDMRPATSYDGHLSVQLRRYEYPCDHGPGFGDTDGCLLPVSDPQPLD
ncbi:MAG: hypothetical protein VX752_03100, partial [Actinomycetota bacterium]|nr:hypothetical protein [Actinomycetota bacterium]